MWFDEGAMQECFEGTFVSFVSQQGYFDAGVGGWWLHLAVLHDQFELRLSHGSVGFFNVVRNSPE